MIYRRTIAFLGSIATVATIAGVPAPTLAESLSVISVQTGHSVVIDAAGLTRIAVGDARIAGVVPIGTAQFIVNGKTPGHTTIFVWGNKGRRDTYEITVTEQSFDDIAKLLRSAINEPDVHVVAFNTNLIVRGTVNDGAAYARLADILERFKGAKFTSSGKGDGVILNTVSVAHPLGDLQERLAQIPGASNLRVDPDPKGNVIVSGNVRDRATAERVLGAVRGLAGPYLSSDGKIVDRLAMELISQIDVKVYILEVDRTAQSQLGLRLQGFANNAIGPGSFTFVENGANPQTFGRGLNVGNFARATLLAPTIDLLMQTGHAKLLSSPDLMTVPGQEATFLVGGKIPIPQSSGLGAVSVTYQEFGVKLKVTPTVLGNGSVETKINPEVSDLDFADGVQINGFTIPALKVSTLSTDVITQAGESIIMGSLLRRIEQKNVQKIPLLGDIPILGALFRSVSYLRQESDVVFILTPTIVTR
ncbi:MAG: pilus assembly protein N-terminal domain-containing protein [Candidatus Eremiobacteraeota bacterium]|nr:pilus assembly protein N-terminal domain-containing protein [Candidatus Eremiobacteraeota bacterium]